MSIKKYIYFGPYIEYTPKQIKTTIDNGLYCKNCQKKRVVEICPTCQQKTIRKTKDVDEPIFDFINGWDTLNQPHAGGEALDENLLIPTSNEKRPMKYDLDNDKVGGSIPLPNQEDIDKDLNWFKQYAGRIISEFKKHEVEHEIKYGFVIHWS